MAFYLLLGLGGLTCLMSLFAAIVGLRLYRAVQNSNRTAAEDQRILELHHELHRLRQEQTQLFSRLAATVTHTVKAEQGQLSRELGIRQDLLQRAVIELTRNVEASLSRVSDQTEKRLQEMQRQTGEQLEQMRLTVDEKLQHTLENRLNQSFAQVSDRLEQVYRGLGEMQTLAEGVGDLKKVLSNVKTRGMLGEVQLGAILSQLLAPEQYQTNVATKEGSGAVVEFAVLLPGDEQQPVYLPIDAKFPADASRILSDAVDQGDPHGIASAKTQLTARIRSFAKDVRDKYIDPPRTTDFAILFLPFEGLYAQALDLGLAEQLQRDFKVTLAGPTTMAALLNSLQMGFRTLAIQKRSGEVWQVLGRVKTEFDRFGEVLGLARRRLEQTGAELDRLIGARTRMIQKQLAQLSEAEQGARTVNTEVGETPDVNELGACEPPLCGAHDIYGGQPQD